MGNRGDGSLFQRFGVRGRLLLAFFGISAFAVLAAAAAMYSFSEVGKVLGRITEQRVPSALASLELSRQAERIVAAAPALLTVTTTVEHVEQSSRITSEVKRLVALLTDLRGSASDAAVLEAIEPAVARLDTNLDSLDGLVADRLAISEKKKAASPERIRNPYRHSASSSTLGVGDGFEAFPTASINRRPRPWVRGSSRKVD